jgi:hypothetical protein
MCKNYVRYRSPLPHNGEASFAASNTSILFNPDVWFQPIAFVTGGGAGSRFVQFRQDPCGGAGCVSWGSVDLPMPPRPTAGAFSLAARVVRKNPDDWHGVIVGGDLANPNEQVGVAAYSSGEGSAWNAAATQPHGYRSSVAYDAPNKTWITVGPNGTDISTDDGRNWRALKPSPTDTPDADQKWSALSLPFVVGPHGRIGILRSTALEPAKSP